MALPAGFRTDGPAIIEEFGSTTVVFPGQWIAVDERGILIVRRSRAADEASR
jgi:N-methylhydantoinase A